MSYDKRRSIQDALDAATSPTLPFNAGLPGRTEAGWHTVTRADGLIVRLEEREVVSQAQWGAADALVLGLDLSAGGLSAAELLALRALAKQFFDADDAPAKRDRVIAWLAALSDNLVRKWLMDFKAGIAVAQTLAQIKTLVAGLPDLPPLTKANVRDAYRGRVDEDAPPPP